MQIIEGFNKNKVACAKPISNSSLSLNISNLYEAMSYVYKLPYGRNVERSKGQFNYNTAMKYMSLKLRYL
jgi:hypothetical protein